MTMIMAGAVGIVGFLVGGYTMAYGIRKGLAWQLQIKEGKEPEPVKVEMPVVKAEPIVEDGKPPFELDAALVDEWFNGPQMDSGVRA